MFAIEHSNCLVSYRNSVELHIVNYESLIHEVIFLQIELDTRKTGHNRQNEIGSVLNQLCLWIFIYFEIINQNFP